MLQRTIIHLEVCDVLAKFLIKFAEPIDSQHWLLFGQQVKLPNRNVQWKLTLRFLWRECRITGNATNKLAHAHICVLICFENSNGRDFVTLFPQVQLAHDASRHGVADEAFPIEMFII